MLIYCSEDGCKNEADEMIVVDVGDVENKAKLSIKFAGEYICEECLYRYYEDNKDNMTKREVIEWAILFCEEGIKFDFINFCD